MKLEKQIKRALRFARPILLERYGKEETVELVEDFRREFYRLAPGIPDCSSPLNQMTNSVAVDILALNNALPEDIASDEKEQILGQFVNNFMDGQFENFFLRTAWKNRFLHRILRKVWIRRVRNADDPQGQMFEWVPPKNNLYYGMNVTRCGIVRYLKKEGALELASLVCWGDHYALKYWPDDLVFKREQTISTGGEICDFRYFYQ